MCILNVKCERVPVSYLSASVCCIRTAVNHLSACLCHQESQANPFKWAYSSQTIWTQCYSFFTLSTDNRLNVKKSGETKHSYRFYNYEFELNRPLFVNHPYSPFDFQMCTINSFQNKSKLLCLNKSFWEIKIQRLFVGIANSITIHKYIKFQKIFNTNILRVDKVWTNLRECWTSFWTTWGNSLSILKVEHILFW